MRKIARYDFFINRPPKKKRDIHQDNGELMEAVQMINGKKPAACPTLKDLAAKKGPDNGSKVPDPDVAQHKEETPVQTAQVDAANGTEEPKTPQVGMSCMPGHMKCANRGETPEYHECVNGLLMSRLCAEGTVCNTNGDAILCNYPTEEVAKKLAAKLNPTAVGSATRQDDTSAQVEAAPAIDATEAVHEAETLPQLDDHYKKAVQKSYDIQESVFYDVFAGFPAETYTASKPMATGPIYM